MNILRTFKRLHGFLPNVVKNVTLDLYQTGKQNHYILILRCRGSRASVLTHHAFKYENTKFLKYLLGALFVLSYIYPQYITIHACKKLSLRDVTTGDLIARSHLSGAGSVN